MSEQRPYLRAQRRHWWAQRAYRGYTIRELCGVALALYAAILLIGLVCLVRGPESFEAYRQFLASPGSVLIHLLLLMATLWHAWTWFQILPKTLPRLVWRGKVVPQAALTRTAVLLAVVCSTVMLLAVFLAGA